MTSRFETTGARTRKSTRSSSTPQQTDYKAIVLGGGPAGSCAAGCLARLGRKVLVIEQARFPRFHVGESWLPLANPILRRLGLTPELEGLASVSKFGATFRSACGEKSARIDFCEAPDVPEPRSFHSSRAEFDDLLLRQARALGAEIREGCAAQEVDLDGQRPRVRVRDDAGQETWLQAEFVLDATGRRGLIANQLGLRVTDPDLRKTALFAHFEGVPHLEGRAHGDIQIACRAQGGWVWLIPLPEGRMSIGFVFDNRERPKELSESPEGCLDRWIMELPLLDDCRDKLRRISPARWEADFSYGTKSYHGKRWLLLGDAGSFLDPVFSSGGQIALSAGAEAADAIESALAGGERARRKAFDRYERSQRRRLQFFRRLVLGFYRPAFQELMFEPETWPAGARALASMLAGQDRPRLTTRLRVAVLFLIVRIKERRRETMPGEGKTAPVLRKSPWATRRSRRVTNEGGGV